MQAKKKPRILSDTGLLSFHPWRAPFGLWPVPPSGFDYQASASRGLPSMRSQATAPTRVTTEGTSQARPWSLSGR
ncbi:hypothetical protein KAM380_017090 [Aeromonas caviae]|nr:hypothetical protein KAM380_017090 [Aeromonas caviae]